LKKKFIYGIVIIIAGTFSVVYFMPFASSEIIVLEHLTEKTKNEINQICLVKNPPRSSENLSNLINDFNKENPTSNGLYNRLFIKEHDFDPPFLPFAWNIDYSAETTTRNDLDNIDFLGDSHILIAYYGDTIKRTKVYIGEIYYYQK